MVRGELFSEQVSEARKLNLGVLTMPMYHEARMSNEEANAAPWKVFQQKMRPLGTVSFENTDGAEYLLTDKDVAWGVEDINIFVGQEGRDIRELCDLSDEEGTKFFKINFLLAEGLLNKTSSQATQINIGFNPGDVSVGHHSILKLHSHVRSVPHEVDLSRRQQYNWDELERFDQMAFIEPFADLYHDYVRVALDKGLLRDFLVAPPERRLGYTSLFLNRGGDLPELFPDIKKLYIGMQNEYNRAARIFTDGIKDPRLNRYIPRPLHDRTRLLEAFFKDSGDIYTDKSRSLLEYLCKHIVEAETRDIDNPRDMLSAHQIYISRGFGGALTFSFDKADNSRVRMDFLPRVITTSGVTKTIMGDTLPTVIARTKSLVSKSEREITATYHQNIIDILRETVSMQLTEQGVTSQ